MTTNFIGTYDWATSDTWTPTEEDRIHLNTNVSGTLLASGNHNGVILEDSNMEEINKPLENIKESEKLILPDGNIRRYLNSDIIDEFKPGQAANLEYPNGYGHGTRVKNVAQTITTQAGGYENVVKTTNLRIRKLTPKECWRLQGFDDSDYDKAAKVNSESQLYKQAGNSIAVPCLTGILTNIFSVERE